ncbi:MAG: hypothetical protein HEQ39_00415 [Rhizobacter sp.]
MKNTCRTSLSSITLAVFLSACGGSDNDNEKISASESPKRSEAAGNKSEALVPTETLYDDQLVEIDGVPYVEKVPANKELSAIKVCDRGNRIQAIRFKWSNGIASEWGDQYGAMRADDTINCGPSDDATQSALQNSFHPASHY